MAMLEASCVPWVNDKWNKAWVLEGLFPARDQCPFQSSQLFLLQPKAKKITWDHVD